MLMSMLNEPDNHQPCERDLKYAFWQNHAIVDAAIGTFIEYGTTDRDKNKAVLCRAVAPVDLRGLLPDLHAAAREIRHQDPSRRRRRRPGSAWSRTCTSTPSAQFFAVGWPVNFWRIEAQTEKDFEWFEHKYPGWYAKFGEFWKWYAKLSKPGETNILTFNQGTGYVYPHRCWSCLVPCLIREDILVDEIDGELHTFARRSALDPQDRLRPEYEGRPTPAMGGSAAVASGRTCYHGLGSGGLHQGSRLRQRTDGKTLIPQPHLIFDDKAMWTLDHVKRSHDQEPADCCFGKCPTSSASSTCRRLPARASRSIPCN